MQKRSNRTTKASLRQPRAERAANSDVDREKNPAAVALGRLGGLKGGKARAETLTKARREEIAKKAALARWSKLASE